MTQDEQEEPLGGVWYPEVLPERARHTALDRWYGAVGAALAIFLGWLLAAQLVPGLVVGVVIATKHGAAAMAGDGSAAVLAPYLPTILLGGTVMSALLVLFFRWVGWLAPTPRAVRGLGARLLWIGAAIVACVGGSIVISLLLHDAGSEVTEQELLLEAGRTGGLLFILAVSLIGPIGEELVFRRLMFSALDRGAGRIVAYTLSALLFAVAHFHAPAFPLYAWMGLCFAFAYVKSGSVLGALAVHVANNTWAVLLMTH